jgi:hemolysin activation/secretion protein
MRITARSVLICIKLLAVAWLLVPIFAHAQAQIKYFDINRFVVEGHTLLKPDELVEVLNPFIGKNREYQDLQRAIEALKQRYRANGVCIAGIMASEQNFELGEITLRIVDQRIGKLTVEGRALGGEVSIRSCSPEIGKEVVLNTNKLPLNAQLANPNTTYSESTQPEHFDINRFMVEGNTLLLPEEIEAVLKPFTGRLREYGEVQLAVAALKQRYLSGGFNIAGVIASEQDFDRGIVTLQIIETRTGKFSREGYRKGDDSNIRARLSVLKEELLPEVVPIVVSAQQLTENPANQAQPPALRFDIDHFNIEGNSLLQAEEISALLKPFTGKLREYGDLQRAIETLKQRYRAKGFSAVWVVAPEQDIDKGIVTLRVIEAKISKITIEGNLFFDEANIRASLPSLREGMSPRAGDISANTQLANENPAKQVDIVLRAGNKTGEVEAIVNVIDSNPRKTFMTLDNSGNSQTGNYRLGVGFQEANLFNHDAVGTLNYVTSPGKWDQVSLYSASYRMPLYSRGDSMDFILAYSDVSAGTAETVAGPLTFSGKGSVYSLHYNQLLAQRGEYSHRLVYGLENRAYLNNCTLGSFGASGCGPSSVDITLRPASLAYSGTWATPGLNSDFYLSISKNFPGGVNGRERDFNAARPSPNGAEGAPSHYTIFRMGSSINKIFENNWQLRAAFNGQNSPNPLVSGEQFGMTGSNAVRGFLEREISRDNGYLANFELYTPSLFGEMISGEGSLRALMFYDIGMASNNILVGEAKQQISISSIGAGFRWNIQKYLNMRFDLARVIKEGGSKNAGDLRGHISAYIGY